MKREIKFRAQAIHNGEWVYGLPSHYNRDPKREKWMICDEDGLGTDIDEETLCQFTGLHDKNGKEIYEGDKVCVPEKGIYGVVWYDSNWNCFAIKNWSHITFEYTFVDFLKEYYSDKLVVYGNTYDHRDVKDEAEEQQD